MDLIIKNIDINDVDLLCKSGYTICYENIIFISYNDGSYIITYEEYFNPHNQPKQLFS